MNEDFLLKTDAAKRLYHEYAEKMPIIFLGQLVEDGEYAADFDVLGQIVEDICCHNTVRFFGFDV